MNRMEAIKSGLVLIPSGTYREFNSANSYKEELKEHIKKIRKQYSVRIVMVTESSGSGYHRYVKNFTYAEPILLDYLFVEKHEEEKEALKTERIKIENEYRCKLSVIENKEITFFTKLENARANIESRKAKINNGKY